MALLGGPGLLLLFNKVAGGVTSLPRLAGAVESSERVELSKEIWTDKAYNGYKLPGRYRDEKISLYVVW